MLNGYLAALGEAIATRHSNEADGTLDDICNQSKEAVSFESAQLETYVSTENLLPNKAGLQLSAGLPTSGKVTRYRKGDTLIANIRPYFKKIWYATDEGTCSGDVIVFRANDVRYAPYVFFSLFCDEFFKYVMLGAKGTKMPRGDKKQMMTFPICTNCNSTDLQLLHELASMIGTNHAESRQLARLRDVLLPELMSGEIDVSKVDLTQLNSHLYACMLQCMHASLRAYALTCVLHAGIWAGYAREPSIASSARFVMQYVANGQGQVELTNKKYAFQVRTPISREKTSGSAY